MEQNKIILFQEKQIRREWHDGAWWFSVVDVIEILSESTAPKKYWTKLKRRLKDEGFFEVTTDSSLLKSLKMTAADGKRYLTDAAPMQTVLRLMMSVQSPKAEPFRVWLAQVGRERIEEIDNPELGYERIRAIYRAKGYPDEWIESRWKSIETRKELTDEWQKRGVIEGQEYAILTAEIARATFGLSPSQHAKFKGLGKQNLRDHMTKLELIFTMLGEEATRINAVNDDAQGFAENHDSAQKGGRAAGNARQSFEKIQQTKVVSTDNFLHLKGDETAESLPTGENSEK